MAIVRLLFALILAIIPTAWAAGLTWFFYFMNWLELTGGQVTWFICLIVLGIVQVLGITDVQDSITAERNLEQNLARALPSVQPSSPAETSR